jgi:hypothetical protein
MDVHRDPFHLSQSSHGLSQHSPARGGTSNRLPQWSGPCCAHGTLGLCRDVWGCDRQKAEARTREGL